MLDQAKLKNPNTILYPKTENSATTNEQLGKLNIPQNRRLETAEYDARIEYKEKEGNFLTQRFSRMCVYMYIIIITKFYC